MIRRARAGNTNAKLSVWDRKNDTWMSAAEAGKKATPLKSVHLNNIEDSNDPNSKPPTGDDADSSKSAEDSENDSSNESNKSAEEEDDIEDNTPFKPSTSSKRRKLASRLHGPDETRLIEIKRWVQLPPQVAEKQPEPSFLAQRRPGMPPLYQPEYAHRMFGQYHSSSTFTSATGYDLGEGGGLNNASGVMAASTGDGTAVTGTATPTRKNIPPRRKKKKLGGPGRRPKNATVTAMPQTDGANDGTAAGNVTGIAIDAGSAMEGIQATDNQTTTSSLKAEEANLDDNAESGSEAEGSEEGEIDESGGTAPTNTDRQEDELPSPTTNTEVTAVPHTEQTLPTQHPVSPDPTSTNEAKDSTNTQALAQLPSPSTTALTHPQPSISAHTTTTTTPPPASQHPIPTFSISGPNSDPEEKAIIEENAQAITNPGERTDEPQMEGVSQAIERAAAGGGTGVETEIVEVEPAAAIEGEGEVDLLGGLDEAIDRGISEAG